MDWLYEFVTGLPARPHLLHIQIFIYITFLSLLSSFSDMLTLHPQVKYSDSYDIFLIRLTSRIQVPYITTCLIKSFDILLHSFYSLTPVNNESFSFHNIHQYSTYISKHLQNK